MKRLRPSLAAVIAVAALALSGCATPAAGGTSGQSLGTTYPPPPTGEVAAQGTVMDVAGEVKLCLGGIAESYPPQCSGIPLEGWSWEGIDGSETSGDTRWGAYALQGTYDGSAFTSTQPPIMLALYDPAPSTDMNVEPADTPEDRLIAIQADMSRRFGADFLSSSIDQGHVWVDVVWDEDTWQNAADEEFGESVVIIRSALRTVG